jgi:hypothetical protein
MSLRRLAFACCLAVSFFLAGILQTHAEDGKAGEPLSVAVESLSFALLQPAETRFGNLTWMGGLHLKSEDPRFGGFSGLAVSADGARIVAVSDEGWWLGARLEHREGTLGGLADAVLAPLLAKDGKRSRSKIRRDAEALAAWDGEGIDGRLLVGFEHVQRVEAFEIGKQGFAARPRMLFSPKEIASGKENVELEALGHLWEGPRKGCFIALSEANLDPDGNIRGWLWKDKETEGFALVRHGDYALTDLAVLPGGEDFITLERSYSPPVPVGMALRRFRVADLKQGAIVAGELLFEGRLPIYAIDNMEALAAHKAADGRIILTVLSDDNFNRSLQRTLLLQFALEP